MHVTVTRSLADLRTFTLVVKAVRTGIVAVLLYKIKNRKKCMYAVMF